MNIKIGDKVRCIRNEDFEISHEGEFIFNSNSNRYGAGWEEGKEFIVREKDEYRDERRGNVYWIKGDTKGVFGIGLKLNFLTQSQKLLRIK